MSYDRNNLSSLLYSLRSLIPLAKTSSDLIDLGKAIETIEKIRAGKRADCSLYVGCWTLNEAGDEDREYACVHIDSEGINLSVLESEEYGGNEYHDPREFAFTDDFSSWLKVFDRVREQADAHLVVQINS